MSNLSRFLVTMGIIAGFLIILAIIVIKKTQTGNSSYMMFAVIAFFGLVAGLKAVWKKKNDTDSHHLDKN